MSQEPSRGDDAPPEERLSGTLFGGTRTLARALGGLSTTFAGVGIAALILGVILLIFIRDLSLYSYIILAVGGVLVLASVAISFETVRLALTSRRGRYGTNTVIMVVAFVGIAGVVNFLAFENSARMDVTATKRFSLAPRTVDVLKGLGEPVEAKAFFSPPGSAAEEAVQNQIDDLLHEFEVRSGEFSYKFVDPEIDPGIAREYEVTQYGAVVFEGLESKKRHHVTLSPSLEQDYVTALLIVSGLEQKQVHFLVGHGERDISDLARDTQGFGLAQDGIENENYAPSTLALFLDEGEETLFPSGTGDGGGGLRGRPESPVSMLVVVGPTKDLLDGEAELLDLYLKGGGNMLFLLESDTPESFREFLARWGIVVGDGHIVDNQRSVGDDKEITILSRGQYFSILPEPFESFLRIQKMTGRLDTTYFPGLTALEPSDGVLFFPSLTDAESGEEEQDALPTIVGTALAVTSSDSWMIKEPTRASPQPGDPRGPFFPAVAIKALGPLDEELPSSLADVKVASIVAFGDTDFATNRYFYTSNNSDFFLNSINWLVGDIPLANIRPKPIAFRELVLTSNEFDFMRYSGWLLLPALMAVLGGFAWWKRR